MFSIGSLSADFNKSYSSPSSIFNVHISVLNCEAVSLARFPLHSSIGTYKLLPPRPNTPKPHNALRPLPLDRKGNINLAMQAINGARDPGHLIAKINLIAQLLARQRVRAQRIQRRVDDGVVDLLVVEDAHGGRPDDGQHQRQVPPDAPRVVDCVECGQLAVASPAH